MQRDCATSLWRLYKDLITLRRAYGSLTAGTITDVTSNGSVLSYRRILGSECLAIALNFGMVPRTICTGAGMILLSTARTRVDDRITGDLELGSGEGVIVKLDLG
jgi:alpha-glucosidase